MNKVLNRLKQPRKCLGFKTPYQVFFERTGIDARQLGVVHL
jgi:IS30 family transposase